MMTAKLIQGFEQHQVVSIDPFTVLQTSRQVGVYDLNSMLEHF